MSSLSISTFSLQTITPLQPRDIDPKEVKVQKLALTFFASISFAIGSLALFTGLLEGILLAIPFFISGGIIFWKVTKYVDYTSSSQISLFRSQAARQSLFKTVRQHGWKKMFEFGILQPESFPVLYRKAVKNLSLNELISFYEIAESHRKFAPNGSMVKIPKPVEFKEKLFEEAAKMDACDIYHYYDIPKLHSYGIASDELNIGYAEYQKVAQEYNQAVSQNDILFRKKAIFAFRKFQNILKFAVGETASQRNWIKVLKQNAYSLSLRAPIHWSLEESIFQDLKLNRDERVDFLFTAQKEFNRSFRSALSEFAKSQTKAKTKFQAQCSKINKRF